MQKKELARGILFILLVAIIFQLLTTIFVPKWYGTWQSTRIVDGFYELPQNSLDVVLMGSSQTIMGLSPMELYEDCGISSYSFGTEEQPMYATYYWLKEILRFHSPQVVVLDINELLHNCSEASYRKAFDYMEWSNVKWEAVQTHCQKNEDLSILSYLFPFIQYHSRWDELSKDDFTYLHTKKADPYFGFVISSGTCEIDYKGIEAQPNALPDQANPEAYEYLLKIIALCQQKNMDLLFTKTPRAGWSPEEHNLFEQIAAQYQIPFLDFNNKSIMQEMGFDYGLDARDGSHLNIYGAEKVGKYLGTYLKENYNLQDHRTDEAYTFWADMLPVYEKQKQDAKLVNTTIFREWLELLPNQHVLLLAVSDGYLLWEFDEEIWLKLSKLGLNIDALKSGADYVAVAEQGSTQCEHADLGIHGFTGILSDGSYYSMSVTNPETEEDLVPSVSSIEINHEEYAISGEGLHFVVYDPSDQEIVDSIWVNTQAPEYYISR